MTAATQARPDSTERKTPPARRQYVTAKRRKLQRMQLLEEFRRSQEPPPVVRPQTPVARLEWWLDNFLVVAENRRGQGLSPEALSHAALEELTEVRQLWESSPHLTYERVEGAPVGGDVGEEDE